MLLICVHIFWYTRELYPQSSAGTTTSHEMGPFKRIAMIMVGPLLDREDRY